MVDEVSPLVPSKVFFSLDKLPLLRIEGFRFIACPAIPRRAAAPLGIVLLWSSFVSFDSLSCFLPFSVSVGVDSFWVPTVRFRAHFKSPFVFDNFFPPPFSGYQGNERIPA